MMKTKRAEAPRPLEAEPARLVYTHAPVLLGVLLERDGDGWSVDLGTMRRTVGVDPAVDGELLAEAAERGSRVLIDATREPMIVGVVATQRTLTIDAEGRVEARLTSLAIEAVEHARLKVPGAFIQVKDRAVELYGESVLTRGRNLVKIFGAMIKLN